MIWTLADACLREAFSLTIAEARLAAAVAERIGVAIGAARGQIKRIFSKTETSGQPELAALLERFVVVEERQRFIHGAEASPGGWTYPPGDRPVPGRKEP